jgi:hypothetical protein
MLGVTRDAATLQREPRGLTSAAWGEHEARGIKIDRAVVWAWLVDPKPVLEQRWPPAHPLKVSNSY